MTEAAPSKFELRRSCDVPVGNPHRDTELEEHNALRHAWLHWERISIMDNPAGYLFTMAKRDVLRTFRAPVLRRPPPACSQISSRHLPALAELSEMQRQVVYLVDGFGWGLTDTDRILGMSISTVRNHWSRGLARLRASLKSETDV